MSIEDFLAFICDDMCQYRENSRDSDELEEHCNVCPVERSLEALLDSLRHTR